MTVVPVSRNKFRLLRKGLRYKAYVEKGLGDGTLKEYDHKYDSATDSWKPVPSYVRKVP